MYFSLLSYHMQNIWLHMLDESIEFRCLVLYPKVFKNKEKVLTQIMEAGETFRPSEWCCDGSMLASSIFLHTVCGSDHFCHTDYQKLVSSFNVLPFILPSHKFQMFFQHIFWSTSIFLIIMPLPQSLFKPMRAPRTYLWLTSPHSHCLSDVIFYLSSQK